jgi:hypothetical protein
VCDLATCCARSQTGTSRSPSRLPPQRVPKGYGTWGGVWRETARPHGPGTRGRRGAQLGAQRGADGGVPLRRSCRCGSMQAQYRLCRPPRLKGYRARGDHPLIDVNYAARDLADLADLLGGLTPSADLSSPAHDLCPRLTTPPTFLVPIVDETAAPCPTSASLLSGIRCRRAARGSRQSEICQAWIRLSPSPGLTSLACDDCAKETAARRSTAAQHGGTSAVVRVKLSP